MKSVLETVMNPSGLMAMVCLACVVLKAIQLYWRRQKLLKIFKSFPGPPTHWLYGHLQKDELDNRASWAEQYPRCHPMWLGSFLGFLCINHPEYAKAVFSRGGKDTVSLTTYISKRRPCITTISFTGSVLKGVDSARAAD
uniref:Cytochrome P450 n=1 Tax=Chrysemys picta bellii TaxID=8478 RepID=A0A8C3FC76_CHRPI